MNVDIVCVYGGTGRAVDKGTCTCMLARLEIFVPVNMFRLRNILHNYIVEYLFGKQPGRMCYHSCRCAKI